MTDMNAAIMEKLEAMTQYMKTIDAGQEQLKNMMMKQLEEQESLIEDHEDRIIVLENKMNAVMNGEKIGEESQESTQKENYRRKKYGRMEFTRQEEESLMSLTFAKN